MTFKFRALPLMLLLGASCLLGLALPAHAQYTGYYVEAAGGSSDSEFDRFNASGNSARLTVGFKFNDNIAAEASYMEFNNFQGAFTGEQLVFDDQGMVTGTAPSPITGDYELAAFGLDIVGAYPLGRHFEVYGKAGISQWDLELDFTQELGNPPMILSGTFSDEGSGLYFGAGLAYNLNLSVSLRAEYNYYDLSSSFSNQDISLEGASFALRYYF